MSDYLENESNKHWEWKVSPENDTAQIEVDHGDHTHILDVGDISIDEMEENTNQILGDAHRASDHYPKNDNEDENNDENENDNENDDEYDNDDTFGL